MQLLELKQVQLHKLRLKNKNGSNQSPSVLFPKKTKTKQLKYDYTCLCMNAFLDKMHVRFKVKNLIVSLFFVPFTKLVLLVTIFSKDYLFIITL